MVYQFKSFIPVIHESSFIHPLCAVTGNVVIGKNVYKGPGAARGYMPFILQMCELNQSNTFIIHKSTLSAIFLKENLLCYPSAIYRKAGSGYKT
jgi:phenylacetic acid degradation protein